MNPGKTEQQIMDGGVTTDEGQLMSTGIKYQVQGNNRSCVLTQDYGKSYVQHVCEIHYKR